MSDPFIALVKIAGITLLITILWALNLWIVYWDIHRRQLAGQPVQTLPWMLTAAFLPFIGLVLYLLVRFASRSRLQSVPPAVPLGDRRATKLKALVQDRSTRLAKQPLEPAEGNALPTIQMSDFSKETVLSQRNAPPSHTPPVILSYLFVVVRGPDQGKTFVVNRFPAQIGRDLDSLICLDFDVSVSRKHAQIYQAQGGLRVRDLNSTHGTRVNGQVINDQALLPGDEIIVGQTYLRVQYQADGIPGGPGGVD